MTIEYTNLVEQENDTLRTKNRALFRILFQFAKLAPLGLDEPGKYEEGTNPDRYAAAWSRYYLSGVSQMAIEAINAFNNDDYLDALEEEELGEENGNETDRFTVK